MGRGRKGERLSVKEEGRCVGSELGSYPDPCKILRIRIRILQNDANPLDPEPQRFRNTGVPTLKKLNFCISEDCIF